MTTRATIQKLIPTCQRCRRLRRKCDTQLPICRLCEKAGVECTFYDHALGQALPRSYVQSLLTRVDQLQAVVENNASSEGTGSNTITTSPQQAQDSPSQSTEAPQRIVSSGLVVQTLSADGRSSVSPPPSFDVVIPSPGGRSRYWGASSVFALTVEILHHAHSKGLIPVEDPASSEASMQQNHAFIPQQRPGNDADSPSLHASSTCILGVHAHPPDAADIHALLSLYFVSSNTLYGFVDEADCAAFDLPAYLALRAQPDISPRDLRGVDAHRYFRVAMMCAIACATSAIRRPGRAADSLAFYAEALWCVEEVTSEVSPAALQALLLLVVFSLFRPRTGDIWKLLDYACRLTVELGYHTEVPTPLPHTSGVASNSSDLCDANHLRLRRSTFWGLYAIERIVGQLFGRGSDLPETIITTEYPHSLQLADDAVQAPIPGDPAGFQAVSIAHHYRLVYLRSEIFRSLYLPASPPDIATDMAWLHEKQATLKAWRRELDVSDEMAGVATITCDVGYDATICFLFQPLMMKALRATRGVRGIPGNETDNELGSRMENDPTNTQEAVEHQSSEPPPISVPQDNFLSACNLIRTYEKVIRAPESSTLSTYPMTFMSAHYIYLAGCTLVVHALLALDGRVKTLRKFDDGDEFVISRENGHENIDFGVFLDISGSCLVLLAWCAERWPGMLGMLDVYKRLSEKITRALIREGLVT